MTTQPGWRLRHRSLAATVTLIAAAAATPANAGITLGGDTPLVPPNQFVGDSALGNLDVDGGSVYTPGGAVNLIYGQNAGAQGTGSIDGAGSAISGWGVVEFGHSGSGSTNISNGAALSAGDIFLGTFGGAVGTLNAINNGGSIGATNRLMVGGQGEGHMSLIANTANAPTAASGVGEVANGAGGKGYVTLGGGGTTWNIGANLTVGNGSGATGQIQVQNGASLSTFFASTVGANGAAGSVTVQGTGSTFSAGNFLNVGNNAGGTGYLESSAGAQVTAGGANFATGDATSGSQLQVLGAGQFTVTNGGFNQGVDGTALGFVSGTINALSYASFGVNAGSHGSMNLAGGTLNVGNGVGTPAYLTIGQDGTGSVSVNSGGKIVTNGTNNPGGGNGIGLGGNNPSGNTGNGTLIVDGVGSQVNINGLLTGLTVGRKGTGTLNVQNGGTITLQNADGQAVVNVGRDAGSHGTATVTGAGSQLNAAGNVNVGFNSADAHLAVTNGGAMSGQAFFVANNTGSAGDVTVSGTGATLRAQGINSITGNGASVMVGRDGTGALTVSNGGQVVITSNGTPSGLRGGLLAGGNGSAVTTNGNGTIGVTGAGSKITLQDNAAVQIIGFKGQGSMTIDNGGVVEATGANAVALVGRQATATGQVTVDGAGSQWKAGKLLAIGSDVAFGPDTPTGTGGTGTLTVQNGGTVQATTVFIGSGGTLTGDGGTVIGNVTNQGMIAPGASPGTLSIAGDLTLDDLGTVALELGGDAVGQYDHIDVSGILSLDGEIDVSLYGAYSPTAGSFFDVFTALDIVPVSPTFDFAPVSGIAWSYEIVAGDGTETLRLHADAAAAPEPASLALLGLGVGALAWLRRRR